MNIVEKDQKISLAYKLKDTNGRVIEEVPPSHPFVYVHGYENIIPGLEEALGGKNLGDQFTISVTYEKGYGAYRQDLVIEVSKEELQDIGEIWIGMELEMFQDEDDSLEFSVPEDPKDIYNRDESEDGPHVYIVREIKDKTVTLDGNHPFAGMDLLFDVSIINIEPPSITELETGFPDEPDEDGFEEDFNDQGGFGRHWR
ncbi:MAG: hypothetical protein AUK31_08580 [Fibrobacteres bacterium CG2_30_45_31]|nr:MAG: hypothetical protein AUK31_08580 [Fibrobacteres bacterium CG2_30_45_31]